MHREVKWFVKEVRMPPGLPRPIMRGWGNGYVIVPPGHWAWGKEYHTLNVDVHGGLTWDCSVFELLLDGHAKYWPALNGLGCADGWMFGFDTSNWNDNLETWPKERVIRETLKLRDQFL